MHNVKLLNNDANNDLNMIPSTSSSHNMNRRHQRSLNHKRMSFNGKNENSIDADDMDLALSLAFPNDMDNMKKYTDQIWRKTLSSDCDPSIHTPWEKQPEVNKTPAIVWPSTSFSAPKNHFYGEDFWSGGNIFFPTSAPIPAVGSSNPKRLSIDAKQRKKVPGNKQTSVEIDDDFNHSLKKRLSLSSLRTSLCRQKAVENLNNGNAAQATSSNAIDDDEFLQVFVFFLLFYFLFLWKMILYFLITKIFIDFSGDFQHELRHFLDDESRSTAEHKRIKKQQEEQVRFTANSSEFPSFLPTSIFQVRRASQLELN